MVPWRFNTNLDAVPDPARADMKRLFFIDEPGATAKTFESSVLPQYTKSNGLKVLTVAFSAVGAQPLHVNRTAHSALKIPFNVHHQSTSSIDVSPALADKLCGTSFSISDKNIITHRYNPEAVDRTFRELMWSTLPSSGKGFPVSRGI